MGCINVTVQSFEMEVWDLLRGGGVGAIPLTPSLLALVEDFPSVCEIAAEFDAPPLVKFFGRRVEISLRALPKQGYLAIVRRDPPVSLGVLVGPFRLAQTFWGFVRGFLLLPEDEEGSWFDGARLKIRSTIHVPACIRAFAETL